MARFDGASLAATHGDGVPDARLPGLRSADFVADLEPMQRAVDEADLLAGLARAVVSELQADACIVSRVDENRDVVRDVAASGPAVSRLSYVAEEYRLHEFPVTRRVIDSGRSEQISATDPLADDAERALLVEYGFGRVMITRITVDGQPVGLVETYRLANVAFGVDDSARADTLCAFAANSYSRIQLAAKLERNYTDTMEALLSALEARDPYTQAHTGRIRDMAVALAVALKLPSEMHRALRLGAILHDVGKIGIPDRILLKPAKLTAMETEVMRSHPVIGERMLCGIDFIAPALPIIRHHHEWWDGSGYPDGLAGEDIPVGARIVTACDAFDAMTSDRPYRRASTLQDACAELAAGAGTQFDPRCVELLVDIVKTVGPDGLEQRVVRFAA